MFQIYRRSFTLIELMITIILVSILLGAIWTVYNTGFRSFYSQWARSGVKAEAGRLFINITRELNQATSLTTAQEAGLTFTADTDSDGVEETIQYIWSEVAGEPLNRIVTATIPVVNSVNNLSFSYYDASNNLLSFPVTASQVRLVAIDLTAADRDETFHLRSNVKLRDL